MESPPLSVLFSLCFNVKKKKKKKKKRGEANDLKFYTAHGFVVVCKSHLILSRVERVKG